MRHTVSSEPLTTDVLRSPAVAVLCGLEHAGLDLAVVSGRLRVWPVERLTTEHEQLIQRYRDELVTLVRICDEGVQERLAAFKQQLRETPEGQHPRLRVQARHTLRQGRLLFLRRRDAGARLRPLLALFARVANVRGGADSSSTRASVRREQDAGVAAKRWREWRDQWTISCSRRQARRRTHS